MKFTVFTLLFATVFFTTVTFSSADDDADEELEAIKNALQSWPAEKQEKFAAEIKEGVDIPENGEISKKKEKEIVKKMKKIFPKYQ